MFDIQRLRPFLKPSTGIGRGHGKRKSKIFPSSPAATYKEFDAVPKGFGVEDDTWDYGDGEDAFDTIEWFLLNSNVYEILENTPYNDIAAINAFTNGYFMQGQQYKGFSNMDAEEQRYTRSYDRLLDQSVIDSNLKVTRFATPELLFGAGAKTTTLTELQAMKGRVITSKANLSTAAAKVGLSIGDATKQIEYKIHIPAGAKGAGMYIGFKGWMHAYGVNEREFMLNRDIQFEVGKTRYDANRKVFEVDLHFKGLLPHDYK